jgi:1-acyl-sn-glycerol-3-phosphate acyltransferase
MTETPSPTAWTFSQSAVRGFSRLIFPLLARIRVNGLENVPKKGPLLILGNHLSTIDGPLIFTLLPPGVRFVGPGDFKLLFPGNVFVAWVRAILVKRSNAFDRTSLRRMTDVLNAGGFLAMFPEGGTWEKSIYDAKPGAAYLSALTNAPILPIGLGNTYQVWYKIGRFQRPVITVNIGKPMPPVQIPDKTKRAEVLEAATHDIMQRIYDLLPETTQRWYDAMARRTYRLQVEVWRNGLPLENAEIEGGAVLAELMAKPNLISPFIRNAKLPLDPFTMQEVRFLPQSVKFSAKLLLEALRGPFDGYIAYRLGEEKAKALETALEQLMSVCDSPGVMGLTLTVK